MTIQDLKQHVVVIVVGLPGSGKSYFASRLAKMIEAVYINSDQVRKKMFALRTYSPEEKEAVYEQMLSMLLEALNQKVNVVLDATFHRKETREMFINSVAGKRNIQFIEIWASENVIRKRLKKERPFSEADFKVYQTISRLSEPLKTPHLILESTDYNIKTMLQEAVDYLKKYQ